MLLFKSCEMFCLEDIKIATCHMDIANQNHHTRNFCHRLFSLLLILSLFRMKSCSYCKCLMKCMRMNREKRKRIVCAYAVSLFLLVVSLCFCFVFPNEKKMGTSLGCVHSIQSDLFVCILFISYTVHPSNRKTCQKSLRKMTNCQT